MDIKKQCSYREYSSSASDLNDEYISRLMLVNRFSCILYNLHLNDNLSMHKNDDDNYDKLFKVRPFPNFI